MPCALKQLSQAVQQLQLNFQPEKVAVLAASTFHAVFAVKEAI